MPSPTNRLAIFAKHWTPGLVKTRLAHSIGAHNAAALHRAFVATLIERFDAHAWAKVLCYAPAESRDDFRQLAPAGWDLCEQSMGDLGSRLEGFFEQSFAEGYQRVVVLGADSPNLDPARVSQAFAQLQQRDLVLGPASDGGYYLVGARRCTPPIFGGMPWGHEALFQSTLERLAASGWERDRFAVLDAWYDVDEVDDLRRLGADLMTSSDPCLRRLYTIVAPCCAAEPNCAAQEASR